MAATTLAALGIGVLYFLKRSGDKRPNYLYGTLLLTAGFTQLHFLLEFTGQFQRHPDWKFLPIYFSLWLPVLLFSYVKISLYPAYQFRWTDLKHLAFPIGQTLYFICIWLVPAYRHEAGRYFYNPFYGAFEQALFLAGWPLYVLFSVLYMRQRRRYLNRRSLPRQLWYIRKLLKGCVFFMVAYTILSLADFFAFKFYVADLRSQVWYAGAQALSFTTLLLWLCVYGGQVLVWGRKLLLSR
ncbi:hypothetical protein [Neolewinella antarctica]|uniref:Uncharacterized protein n=1 Tax=Neolewinella antarctica TaxID=442734 RepID=A0ABX0XG74_9BACT|nr:hypothetical protein [Neolewinella antarctica]NJC27783.1 hypothetical protein [Neolewinella antarctica]